MNKLLIRFLRLFSPVFERMDINTQHLFLILETKLSMDGRRPGMFNQRYNKSELKQQDWLSVFVFFAFGLFFLILFISIEDTVSAFVLYFAGWMVVLAMTLISDFTEVLIDPRDNYILLPRPVNDRTLTVSRVLHILVFISKLALAFSLPGMIFVSLYFGFAYLPIYLLQMTISVILTIFLVNLIYLLLIKIVPGTYFQEAINYFQIAFTIIIFAVYYLVPRIIDRSVIENINILDNPLTWFLPPVWISSLWATLAQMQLTPDVIGLSLLAVTAPVLALYAISTFLAKDFSQKLFNATQAGGNQSKKKKTTTGSRTAIKTWFSGLLTQNNAERAAFEWTWMMTLRSRDFKLRVYPSLALVPFFFVYFGLQGDGTVSERITQMQESNNYILLIYLCLILLTNPFIISFFSSKDKAAWLFYAHPVEKPGTIMLGSFKALLVQYFLPTMLIMLLISTSIWGIKVVDDFLLGIANIVLIGVLMALMQKRRLPFSASWEIQKKGENAVTSIVTMLIAGVLGMVHYFLLLNNTLLILSLTAASTLLFSVLLRKYSQTSWEKLNY